MHVVNRLIKSDEIVNLKELLTDAYKANEKFGINFATGNLTIDEIEKLSKTISTYVSVYEGEIVSAVSIRYPWSNNPGPYAVPHLSWIATSPKYKHQGLSSNLIHWVEENVVQKELHSPAVSLGTALEHPWLVSFYEKLGFKKVETVNKFSNHTTVYLLKTLDETVTDNPFLSEIKKIENKTEGGRP